MDREFIGSIPVERLANDSMEVARYLDRDGANFKGILDDWLRGGSIFNYNSFQDVGERNKGIVYGAETVIAAIEARRDLTVSTTEVNQFIDILNSYGYEEAVIAALS